MADIVKNTINSKEQKGNNNEVSKNNEVTVEMEKKREYQGYLPWAPNEKKKFGPSYSWQTTTNARRLIEYYCKCSAPHHIKVRCKPVPNINGFFSVTLVVGFLFLIIILYMFSKGPVYFN